MVNAYWLSPIINKGASGHAINSCAVSDCVVGHGYTDAEGTSSQKIRLLDISN